MFEIRVLSSPFGSNCAKTLGKKIRDMVVKNGTEWALP
jgi:hypothetical protein